MTTDAIYHHQVFEYMRRGLPPSETIDLVAAGQWSPSRKEDMLDKGVTVAFKALVIAAVIASEGDIDFDGAGDDLKLHDPHCVYVAGLTARSLVIACVGFKQGRDKSRPPALVTKGLYRFLLERDLDRIRPLNQPGPNVWPGLIAPLKRGSLRIQFASCTRLFLDNWQRGDALLRALDSMRARRAAAIL